MGQQEPKIVVNALWPKYPVQAILKYVASIYLTSLQMDPTEPDKKSAIDELVN